MWINSLIQFTAGQKAEAADINTNFETLRKAHNDFEEELERLRRKLEEIIDA